MTKEKKEKAAVEAAITLEGLRKKPDIQDVITYFQNQIDQLKKGAK